MINAYCENIIILLIANFKFFWCEEQNYHYTISINNIFKFGSIMFFHGLLAFVNVFIRINNS